jgi:rhodanese-related sulfurtransferase
VREALAVALACIGFAGLACAEAPTGGTAGASISAAELVERIASNAAPFVLDVRSPEEFAKGHVPGAVNIPHTELASRQALLPPQRDTELVVHCESGRRAGAAEQWLRDEGYTRVRDLEGHMRGWRAAGHPTE